jgi:hypothetical protein
MCLTVKPIIEEERENVFSILQINTLVGEKNNGESYRRENG